MSKMTDKDIIKALEFESTPMERNCVHATYKEDCLGFYCTKTGKLAENCMECKEHKMDWRGRHSKATLDLINRIKGDAIHYRRKAQNQKQELSRLNAEIEKLTINMNAFGLGMKREKERADTIRAEAIKEFAKKIDDEIYEALTNNENVIREREIKHKVNRCDDIFCASTMGKNTALCGIHDFIVTLVEEMVGEGK